MAHDAHPTYSSYSKRLNESFTVAVFKMTFERKGKGGQGEGKGKGKTFHAYVSSLAGQVKEKVFSIYGSCQKWIL